MHIVSENRIPYPDDEILSELHPLMRHVENKTFAESKNQDQLIAQLKADILWLQGQLRDAERELQQKDFLLQNYAVRERELRTGVIRNQQGRPFDGE